MSRQHQCLGNVYSVLKNGEGVDNLGGFNVKIKEASFVIENYIARINALLGRINAMKHWAIDSIEGCLHIGCYDRSFPDEIAFRDWMKSGNIDSPIVDFRQSFYVPIGIPPFLFNFPQQAHFDLVSGKRYIKQCLDIPSFIKLANEMGLEMYWCSKRETAKCLSNTNYPPLIYKHRAIQCKRNEKTFTLGSGILSRIFLI